MSKFLPSEYYLAAKDPKHAVMTAGKVFLDPRSALRWLFDQAKRDVSHLFEVKEIEKIYYGSNLKTDFT